MPGVTPCSSTCFSTRRFLLCRSSASHLLQMDRRFLKTLIYRNCDSFLIFWHRRQRFRFGMFFAPKMIGFSHRPSEAVNRNVSWFFIVFDLVLTQTGPSLVSKKPEPCGLACGFFARLCYCFSDISRTIKRPNVQRA